MNKTTLVSQQTLAPTATVTTAAALRKVRLETWLIALGSHLILAFFTVVIVYPVVWMLLASLKSNSEIVTNVWGLPQTLQWENYTGAWESADLGYALLNSVLVSVGTVLMVTTLAALAGFAFAKFSFRLP